MIIYERCDRAQRRAHVLIYPPTDPEIYAPALLWCGLTMRMVLLLSVALARESRAFIAPLCAPGKLALLRCIQTGAPEDEILAAASRLEWLNPSVFTGAVASDNLPGNWLMVYTTSDSIAGKSRPKIFQARKPPEQLLEVGRGRACNSERVLGVRNAVDIALSPATRNRVDVRFETFRIGPLAIPAPDLTGSLATTYLDEDMRRASFVEGWPFLTVAARAATTSRFSSLLACSGLLGTDLFSGAGETDRQTDSTLLGDTKNTDDRRSSGNRHNPTRHLRVTPTTHPHTGSAAATKTTSSCSCGSRACERLQTRSGLAGDPAGDEQHNHHLQTTKQVYVHVLAK